MHATSRTAGNGPEPGSGTPNGRTAHRQPAEPLRTPEARRGRVPWGPLAIGVVLLFGLGTLSWFDVLPGGWTLRGWVEPHHEREARRWREYREDRLDAFRGGPPAPAGAVAFLGSSTIERMPFGAFAAPCVDRGIGMEAVSDLRDRIEVGLPGDLAGAVVYAASIDFRRDRSSPERTAGLVSEVLDRIETARPGTPVCVIGILSEVDLAPEMVELLARTNEALAARCAERDVAFVPTDRPPLRRDDGAMDPTYTDDGLHLNAAGYEHLTRWILEDGGEVGAILGG